MRGLHLQVNYLQGKLVRVIRGKVFDVGVELRGDSKNYGEWYGEILSEDNKKQLYIPPGFAHGFLVLSDEAEFTYKYTEFYTKRMKAESYGMTRTSPLLGQWIVLMR